MSVIVSVSCSGCNAGPVHVGYARREFVPLFTGSGFGRWRTVWPTEPPDGWEMFDPYTGVPYCPVCAEELFGPPVNQDAAHEIPASFDHYAIALGVAA